jgi:hypothetical protein
MVTNRVGQPVRGDDFFGREQEQGLCWEYLDSDHLLLLAPRRVGKTSLMLKLEDDAVARGYEAAYMSSAEATDEAAFVQRLYETVGELTAWRGIWQRLSDGPAGRMLKSIQKIDVGGFSVELGGAEREQWALLGEKLARAIEQQEGKCLLLIDELPVFVLSLLRQDPSGERARRFLTWFRGLRQRSATDGGLRWLLAGSIGLDTVAARLNLGDTINDLRIFHLGPFSRTVADALLQELGATYKLPLSEEVRGHILQRVGWTIPFYLQLSFSELRGRCDGVRPGIAHVDAVFDDLLRPAKKAYFDYWRQRLAEELGKPDASHALALLNAIAVDESGASRSSLSQVLGQHVRNSEQRKEKLRYLLDVLESDGYVVDSGEGERFRFRSPLLREFWVRRVLP